jgi:hypothetical protein
MDEVSRLLGDADGKLDYDSIRRHPDGRRSPAESPDDLRVTFVLRSGQFYVELEKAGVGNEDAIFEGCCGGRSIAVCACGADGSRRR